MTRSDFRISVSKDYLVFSSAHFITLPGDRCEPLHGHNYRTRVAVEGGLEPEAHYVFDFSELKQLMKRLTDEIDHKVLLPLENPKLVIEQRGDRVAVAHDGVPRYEFPRRECALLPIPNTTVEMLARYLAQRARAELERSGERGLRLRTLEVEVEENFGQSATYRAAFD
ncbi:MAG TPA: 6-carboxytetrahydropterin synthase [Gemmatimonadales bacterium]|nr:6-carboxytetrahydropterin synthase [Gemmatimonadales bacterium]